MNDPKIDNKVYRFTLNGFVNAAYATSITVPTFGAGFITLAGLDGSASKLAVFDQYRIIQLELWLIPQGTTPGSMWHSVVDYDNATAPTTLGQVRSYSNCHTTSLNNGHYHKFVPHVATAVYKGAFSGFSNQARQWIDSANNDVQHYGWKVGFETTPGGVIGIDVLYRAVVEFRNPFA